VSVISAITPDEMAHRVQGVDISNGMLNRFGINYGEMAEPLAFGGHIDWDGEVKDIVEAVKKALKALEPHRRNDDDLSGAEEEEEEQADHDEDEEEDSIDPDLIEETDSRTEGIMRYSIGTNGRCDGSEASRLWKPWYDEVRPEGTGSVPALTKRQHVHVARRVNIMSGLELAETVRGGAMRAAMAWEQYPLDSIEYLLGEPVIGKEAELLQAIRGERAQGLTGTGQQKVFSNNLLGPEMQKLRDGLERRNLIATFKVLTGKPGRTGMISFAIWPE
jgi:hypothetical protein